MPGQFYKRRWFFAGVNTDRFRFCGAEYYGFAWGRWWPVLAVVIDDGWYDGSVSVSLCAGPLEAGMFIERGKYADSPADGEAKPPAR